jgi:tripartite-type tricarboxylate transporter receptor subunit TctC
LLAPSKFSRANLDKLESHAVNAARSSAVKEKLSNDSAIAVGNTRAEFEAFIKQEQTRWKAVIARAQIKPDGM